MPINTYLDNINKLYKSGNAREHSYRGDLQVLIAKLVPEVLVTNEPARIECGAPDYIITKRDIPVGYIEAKDIGVDLDSKSLSEQFDRYKASLQNLIFTDYLNFHLYIDGEFKIKIAIAEIKNGKIISLPNNFSAFTDLIKNFCLFEGQTIKSSSTLAAMMAKKARMLENIIEAALLSDIKKEQSSSLRDQMDAFQKVLIHDIKPKEFSDIYSQTIAYGMFAARFHDKTLETFSRQEAAELIPKSNPFLRSLFSYIAGPDIDDRIKWIVESLAEVFRSADVASLLKAFGKATQTQDPIIHFYETFLSEYDPALRKARGVWYTPNPVVNFIVRAIDDILKSEFGIKEGIADNSMIDIDVKQPGEKKSTKKKVHRVQFLDPATGTGTFIAELIRQVYQKFQGLKGIWSNYVENHLIPRLHGFEILMASYAMAHLKIDMLLQETGFKPTKSQRLKIYLTNSLEEYHEDDGTLFALARWLSEEARQANDVKRDTPVMVVMGNPPYAVSSINKSDWIQNLIADYKKDLNEKKINLDDDYIKFIRFGHHFIDKTGEGILAYISNNSFIDGITHRKMRKHLLESFDKIYILDLHGNSNRKEISPDGSVDENVFDIMQGVSINLFIKTVKKKKNELGKVFHYDLFGKREDKYAFLRKNSISNMAYKELQYSDPNYFFVTKNFKSEKNYSSFFGIDELFIDFNSGLQTGRDEIVIDDDDNILFQRIKEIVNAKDIDGIKNKYGLENTSGWSLKNFQKTKISESHIKLIQYKPFDNKFIYYETNALKRDRKSEAKHLLSGENISLVCMRQYSYNVPSFCYVFCSQNLVTDRFFISNKGTPYFFPLYLYPDSANPELDTAAIRKPNINSDIVKKIAVKLKLSYANEQDAKKNSFAPIDILDFIYAVLHSPRYRETYKEFLKIDFPRVPYPEDKKTFWKLVKLGGEMRQIHLLESGVVNSFKTSYPISGDNIVSKLKFENGNVYINETQYFSKVPEGAWNFFIGGYQPAQKWLKNRKDRMLGYEDILHYQKIIVALVETDRLMKEIDKIYTF
ncbi:type ISP restriction/modification enzyme [Leptospira ilyithenensis]|uniref:site-specific DNA-methyltransferase (adenine-specific) n=1 Tax=Leptospira ilyithenensis TaxID=2484901 RepID=A0A4R9LVU2_9LEPT|nr:type ISP restriction/modification enzyme [Leptospira ilyithenensis]TGN13106.1 DNA methyltransferase [Leptospira ilyithenensis]